MKEILENWIKEQNEYYGTGIFYSLEMMQKFAEYYHNLQLHKTQVSSSTLTVPDIRNKLSPITHLIAMLEMDEIDLAKKAIEQSKISINYLAQR